MTNPITAWSFSRLSLYEECPAKFKYRNIDKLDEPKHPAMQRGIDVHKDAERYLKGEDMLPAPTLSKFGAMFAELRQFKPMVEQQWGLTRSWRQTGWFSKDTWLRIIPDAAVVYDDDAAALVIDFKTGKPYGDNAEQMDLFDLGTRAMFPGVREVETRLWYLDSGAEEVHEFDGARVKERKAYWEERVEPMFNDTEFRPRPNSKCKWCHFRRSNGGPCKFS